MYKNKRLLHKIVVISAILATTSLYGCLDDENECYPRDYSDLERVEFDTTPDSSASKGRAE